MRPLHSRWMWTNHPCKRGTHASLNCERGLLLISTSVAVSLVCLSCSARWGGDVCLPLSGVGAGYALWLQLCPPAASSARCWQTRHSWDGPGHGRIRGGNPLSGWIQTLSGAQREKECSALMTLQDLTLSSASLIPCSSRCWHPVQPRPFQNCVLTWELIKWPVRGSAWFWWIMTPSSTFLTWWLLKERSSSAPLAALSYWSAGERDMKMSEMLWLTSARGPISTLLHLSIVSCWTLFTGSLQMLPRERSFEFVCV